MEFSMKIARHHSRDRHEDRCERKEKLGRAMDTLPGKTLRDRIPATARIEIGGLKSDTIGLQIGLPSQAPAKDPLEVETPRRHAASFSLLAPEAASVHVAGTFNNWQPLATSLVKTPDGSWHAHLNLKPGTYEYRFIVDGNWQEDPSASSSVENPFGSRNSIKRVR
jgi:hypothetical protein